MLRFAACLSVLAVYAHVSAADPPVVTLNDLLKNPAQYEGKAIVVPTSISGAVVEGPKWVRLSVNGRSAEVGSNRGKPNGVNFVIAKDQREKLIGGWKADAKYTANLTLTLQAGKGPHWYAVVSQVNLSNADGAAPQDAPKNSPQQQRVIIQAADPTMMSLKQLLEVYDASEADNAVGQRLAKITKGEPCIVFDKNGAVIVSACEALIKDIKDGFAARNTYLINGVPHKTYKVGESPKRLFAENPLYPGFALRSDGTCDRTERSWDGVPRLVRQILYLAVSKTGEIKIEKVDDAHAILDKLGGEPAAAEKWVKARFPKAYLLYGDLSVRGELPSLKLTSVQRQTTEAPKTVPPTGAAPVEGSKPSTPQPVPDPKPASPASTPAPTPATNGKRN